MGVESMLNEEFNLYTHEKSELIKRVVSLGTCENTTCISRSNLTMKYTKSNGLLPVNVVTYNRFKTNCPQCGHALFWARNYDKNY